MCVNSESDVILKRFIYNYRLTKTLSRNNTIIRNLDEIIFLLFWLIGKLSNTHHIHLRYVDKWYYTTMLNYIHYVQSLLSNTLNLIR